MTQESTTLAQALSKISELGRKLQQSEKSNYNNVMHIRDLERKNSKLESEVRLLREQTNPFDAKIYAHLGEIVADILSARFEEYQLEHKKALELTREQADQNFEKIMESAKTVAEAFSGLFRSFPVQNQEVPAEVQNEPSKTPKDPFVKVESEGKVDSKPSNSSKTTSLQSRKRGKNKTFEENFSAIDLQKLKNIRIWVLRGKDVQVSNSQDKMSQFFHENSKFENASTISNVVTLMKEKITRNRFDFVIFPKGEMNGIVLSQFEKSPLSKRIEVISYEHQSLAQMAKEVLRRISKKE